MAITGTDVGHAKELILAGKLVAVPTETVYGLAANALDPAAVLSVFEAKNRPHFDPLIIHVHSRDAVSKYAHMHSPLLRKLAAAYWPGPLTLLLEKQNCIPDLVTSGSPLVAVRVPDHQLTLSLLAELNLPLAAPSANPFGYISPTTAAHVQKQLGHRVDYILDGGPCEVGLESTIVSERDNTVIVHRLGGLPVEKIEEIAGKVSFELSGSGNPLTPGQLTSHYAPRKKLLLGDIGQLVSENAEHTLSLICFGDCPAAWNAHHVLNLSPSGDLHDAALNLFGFLRMADESASDIVIAALVPDEGLGKAINDRLRRAAA